MLALVVLPDWLPWAVGTAAAIAICIGISAAFARKRTEALTRTALAIGFNFEGKTWRDPAQAGQLITSLFGKGSARNFRNIMTGSSRGLRVALFDYSYVTGSGRSAQTRAQTVASFSKTSVMLTKFEMEPKGMIGKIGDALFHKNINFDGHPEFSGRYQVRSQEQEKTRELFTSTLLSMPGGLDPKKSWSVESSGEALVVYRANKRVQPDELPSFLEETIALADSFTRLSDPKKATA